MKPTVSDGEDSFSHGTRNTYTLTLATFTSTVGFGISFPFLPLMVLELDPQANANAWVGYITGSFFLIGFLTTPMWGAVADHYGRKLMVLRTGLGMGVLHMLLPVAPGLGWFMFFFLVLGTTNGFVPSAQALVATTTHPSKMGRALSMLHTGTWLGNSLGPAVGAFLAGFVVSYRSLYWVTGGLVLTAGLLGLVFAREERTKPKGPFRLHVIQDLRTTISLPQAKIMLSISYVFAIIYLGNVPVMSLYTLDLLEKLGTSDKSTRDMWVGMVALALPISSALAAPLWGRALDRFGPESVLSLSLITGTLATVPIVFVTSPFALMVARFMLGVMSVGIGLAVLMGIKSRSPKGMEARVMAFGTAVSMLGFGSGPFLAGLVGPSFGLRVYFALNTASLAVMLGVWFLLVLSGRVSLRKHLNQT